jgi:hypothetical protein
MTRRASERPDARHRGWGSYERDTPHQTGAYDVSIELLDTTGSELCGLGVGLHRGHGVNEHARIDGDIQVGGGRQMCVAEQLLCDFQAAVISSTPCATV